MIDSFLASFFFLGSQGNHLHVSTEIYIILWNFFSSPKHIILLKIKIIKDDPSECISVLLTKLSARLAAPVHVYSSNFRWLNLNITRYFNPKVLILSLLLRDALSTFFQCRGISVLKLYTEIYFKHIPGFLLAVHLNPMVFMSNFSLFVLFFAVLTFSLKYLYSLSYSIFLFSFIFLRFLSLSFP